MSKRDQLMKNSAHIRASMGERSRAVAIPSPDIAPRHRGLIRMKDAHLIPVELIGPDPDQPRREFDQAGLERLAQSLKLRGQLQPIRVRWDEPRVLYVILVGERRWRAAQLAGLPHLACIVHPEGLSPRDILAIQLIENCIRDDLKPLEQAHAFRALMDEMGWSTRKLAEELNLDPSTVSKTAALLDLPVPIQDRVAAGQLGPSAAYEFTKIQDPATAVALAESAVAGGLTRDAVIEAVRAVRTAGPAPARPQAARPAPWVCPLPDRGRVTVTDRAGRKEIQDALRYAMKSALDLPE